ncbi:hypothetical protein [Flavobacterium sp.]|uniref:hypothetical protein n=1 Tax=Flavobacterium sp. TaxID=239 RepID=UPI002488EFE3|nr:hypothetical protein [Flavobacterium sp.]MDI1316117.1 hypothetical protein [Flavobacterium sp.]
MIKKIKKLFKIVTIDVLIYYKDKPSTISIDLNEFKIIKKEIDSNKVKYYILVNEQEIHQSFLFKKVYLQKLIKKKGPTIGDCKTAEAFKGKSIYPYVINHIANSELKEGINEVFINVNPDNFASIRGIEKAGFKKYVHLKAKRFLFFYFNVNKDFF